MQQENFSLTPDQQRELQSLADMPDEEIDFSDIPETLDWSGAQRARFYQASQSPNARPETAASSHTLVFTDTTERGLEIRITAILTAERPESDQVGLAHLGSKATRPTMTAATVWISPNCRRS